jgi:hypothetical protein
MTKTKEEILDMIKEDTFNEWFLTTQEPVNFKQNKINSDSICKILDVLVQERVINAYQLIQWSGSFTFLKDSITLIKE